MAKEYEVLSMTESTKQVPTGGLIPIWRVRAQTALGTVFTIEVEDKDLTEKNLKDILLLKAGELDRIKKL